MSQSQVSPVAEVGFVEVGRTPPDNATGYPGVAHALLSILDMDTVLLASPFSLTQARLDTMTLQDKQSAVKTALDNGDINSLGLLPPVVEAAADPNDEVMRYGTVWIAATSGNTFQTDGSGDWVQINT